MCATAGSTGPQLGKIVFADPEARRDLERIVHPAVRARAAELERAAAADAVVVHVIPLLVETGQQDGLRRRGGGRCRS